MGKELDVDVIQNDVSGVVVPVVNGEQVAEVHGLANRSCPFSLPEPRFSDKNERARALHYLPTIHTLYSRDTNQKKPEPAVGRPIHR